MSTVVYVTVGIIQKTLPPVIAVYRDRATALRRSADGVLYAVNDVCDVILSSATGMPPGPRDGCCFDDRDYIYPRLLEIVRGRAF